MAIEYYNWNIDTKPQSSSFNYGLKAKLYPDSGMASTAWWQAPFSSLNWMFLVSITRFKTAKRITLSNIIKRGKEEPRPRPNLQTNPQSCQFLRKRRRPHLERNWESEACYPPLGSNRPASSSAAAATQQINKDDIFIFGVCGVVVEGGFRRRAYLGPHGVLQILDHSLLISNTKPPSNPSTRRSEKDLGGIVGGQENLRKNWFTKEKDFGNGSQSVSGTDPANLATRGANIEVLHVLQQPHHRLSSCSLVLITGVSRDAESGEERKRCLPSFWAQLLSVIRAKLQFSFFRKTPKRQT